MQFNFSRFQSFNFMFTLLCCVILYKVLLNKNFFDFEKSKIFFPMSFRMKAISAFSAISYNSSIASIASCIALGSTSTAFCLLKSN